MKRIKQLQKLSKEHHLSLRLAKKCKDMITNNDADELRNFSLQLKTEFDEQWNQHFITEEKTIFKVAEIKGGEISELCSRLNNEHRKMETMVNAINSGDYHLLLEFGQLLHDHTRLEERQLFPMIEDQFTQDELDTIAANNGY